MFSMSLATATPTPMCSWAWSPPVPRSRDLPPADLALGQRVLSHPHSLGLPPGPGVPPSRDEPPPKSPQTPCRPTPPPHLICNLCAQGPGSVLLGSLTVAFQATRTHPAVIPPGGFRGLCRQRPRQSHYGGARTPVGIFSWQRGRPTPAPRVPSLPHPAQMEPRSLLPGAPSSPLRCHPRDGPAGASGCGIHQTGACTAGAQGRP